MREFGEKSRWFGAALAAFGVGCGDVGEGRGTGDEKDIKDAKIEKAPEEILGQDEVVDDELYIPEVLTNDIRTGKEIKNNIEIEGEKKDVDVEVKKEFKNVLMEEADSVRPVDWMGDKYDEEVERLKKKLPRELSENKFNNSLLQLHKFFVPRKDEAKNDVIGLLSAVKDDKETRFFVNKEYRDKVKGFVEKYSAQYGVPVEVIYGVMAVENAGKHDPNKNKADGAYGIMQVQPGVVNHLKEMKFNGEDWKGVSVVDLEGNIRAGTAYLSYLHRRYGRRSFDLMAYNAGPSAFETRMAGSVEEKIKIRKKDGGWKKWLEDKNLWWACSRHGRAFLENGNAGYAADAMYLSKPIQEIMQSEYEEVELTPLTDEMK